MEANAEAECPGAFPEELKVQLHASNTLHVKDWPEPPACISIPWQSPLVSGALGTTRRGQ